MGPSVSPNLAQVFEVWGRVSKPGLLFDLNPSVSAHLDRALEPVHPVQSVVSLAVLSPVRREFAAEAVADAARHPCDLISSTFLS